MSSFDVIVVGGGVVGVAAAWRLAVGYPEMRVALVDSAVIAGCASGLATGAVHTQRWHREDVQLNIRSKELIKEIAQESGGVGAVREVGRVTLVNTEQRSALRRFSELQRSWGAGVEFVEAGDLGSHLKGLNLDGLGGGVFSWSDGLVHPPALVWAMAESARRRGVTLWEGVHVNRVLEEDGGVVGIETQGDVVLSCQKVILASGGGTNDILDASGWKRLPIDQALAQTAVFVLGNEAVWETVPSVWDGAEGLVINPRNAGTIDASVLDPERAGEMPALLRKRFPGWEVGECVGGWGGLIDITPDNNPIIGELPAVRGVWVGCAGGHYGIQEGPAVGEVLAELCAEAEPRVDVRSYEPGRFLGDDVSGEYDVRPYNPFV